ncbi:MULTISPECIES: TonB-dependent receptor [unclassified Sphingopyxis]|uniref:TonB-dependent receptor n=1 Tax=unclassified Sphingopyxis TaxID=2614943 RepID=UPI00286481AC|nr:MULTISPECIES: TonB-dependent receptor [unclassified Sphingopyxis]MDR6832597.1 iron complex outermembrane receptor protein [Sphingopyxis sp. BE122]MDR7228340.1 iron complex outermembrane receptor protein [Sphingopyxis sp. BE259]
MRSSANFTRLFGSCAAIALLAHGVPTLAQEAEGDVVDSNEIIVTAQKRSERLQDVPVAVTSIGGDQLANANINGASGLAGVAPSLTFTQNTSPLNNNVRVRGIGTVLFSAGIESSVSFVVDGVVMARQGQGFTDLIDVERVEVLRGPQGTLFGKNATAGVINVVTQAPSATFEGKAEATVAEMGEYRLRGTVSGPLSDSVRARLTGFYTKDEGWARNAFRDEDVFGTEDFGLRAKVAIDVAPGFDLMVTGDYRKSDSTCCQPLPFQTTNPLLVQLRDPALGSINNRTVNTTTDTFADVRTGGVSVEGNLELGDHTLTSITAWREWNFDNNVDVDGYNVAAPVRVPFGFGFFGINGGGVDVEQFSEELRLASPTGGLLEYTVGAMYYKLDLGRNFQRRVGGCTPDTSIAFGAACPNPTYQSSGSTASMETENIALFGQVQVNVTERFSALGGFRLQHEKNSYVGTRSATAPFAGDAPLLGGSTGGQSVSDGDFSGKLGLQYKFSRHAQVYASWSRGYKGVGWDVEFSADFAAQPPVEPETVKAWEVGFKGQALDNRLTFGIAAFHAKYDNLQVQATQQVNGAPLSIPTNAGSAVTKGVEMEFSYRPIEQLTFAGGVTYMKARFDSDGLPCQLATQNGAVTVAPGATPPVNTCYILGGSRVQDIRDGSLPNSPDWKANASIRYEDNLSSSLVGFIQVNGNIQSRVLFDLNQDQELDQKGYATADLSVGVKTADDKYQLSFFIRNLTDKRYVSGKQRDNMLTNAANPDNILFFTSKDASRYIGGTVRVNF